MLNKNRSYQKKLDSNNQLLTLSSIDESSYETESKKPKVKTSVFIACLNYLK